MTSKKIRKITDLADICYVRQKNQNGIGDAIKCSQRHVEDEPFAVLLGHSITKGTVPCTKQLINAYEKYDSPIVSLMEVPKGKVHLHRIIKGSPVENGIYKIDEILERPQKSSSNIAMMGRYILTPDIFDKINQTEAGFGGEIHLTDALSKLDSLYGAIFKGKSYYIGNRLEWLKASIEFRLDDEEFRDELIKYMENYTENESKNDSRRINPLKSLILRNLKAYEIQLTPRSINTMIKLFKWNIYSQVFSL